MNEILAAFIKYSSERQSNLRNSREMASQPIGHGSGRFNVARNGTRVTSSLLGALNLTWPQLDIPVIAFLSIPTITMSAITPTAINKILSEVSKLLQDE